MNLDLIAEDFTLFAVTIALSTIRIAVAFTLVPIFADDLIPPLVRNSIYISFAVICVLLQPAVDISSFTILTWLIVVAKEFMVGLAIGVLFGSFLWAFEAAGQIIDAQIGMNMAQVYDPIEGHQTSLLGTFLGRFVNYMFLAVGGLTYFVSLIFESYHVWPLASSTPNLFGTNILQLFEQEYVDLFELIVIVASPVLVICFMIDLCMGLINRESQQFNVYFLSMPLKTLAAVLILAMGLSFIVDQLVKLLSTHVASFKLLLVNLI